MRLRRAPSEDEPVTPPERAGGNHRAPSGPLDLEVKAGGGDLGALLVDANLVTSDQVSSAAADVASQRDEEERAASLARDYAVDQVDLRQVRPDPAVTVMLAESQARALTAIPLSMEGSTVLVAVSDPSPEVVASVRTALGRPVKVAVATPSGITMAIGQSYRALSRVDSQVEAFEAKDSQRREVARAEFLSTSRDAPVVQVVQLMITQGLRDRASDIHVEQQGDKVRVRFRVDGALHDVLDLPGAMGPAIVSRIKILADMNIVERRRPQDGQISMSVEGREVDIRVSTTSVVGGEKVVMRLLDKSRPLFHLGQLGMRPEMATAYAALLRSPYGMVICAGPTGSGKTTTLYGSLSEINTTDRNIMTIEDPVEYTIPLINQIQINVAAGVTFAGGLKSILRQDPDVILVGEIRDVETARIAVQSALTGHFVLSSLHATDAVSALHRLLDMGVETFLVASSVSAVLSQRLVRRVCDHCRVSYQPPPEELTFLHAMGGTESDQGFVRGTGCNFCSQTGYLDRIGVYEMMPISSGIRELILARASHEEIRVLARAEGMRTLQEESLRLVDAGITNLAEVLRAIYVVGS